MSTTIVFYDKMDNDGKGARAVFELSHKDENVLYIGLDRDMMIRDREIFKRSLGLKRDDLSIDKMHYLDYLENSGYSELLDENIEAIYMLDLAPRYNKEMLKSIEADRLSRYSIVNNINVKIIDHHKLRYNIAEYGFEYIYKDGVSACMLTWEHFNPNKSAPYVVSLINDRDIWLNKMQPQTNYFHNVSEMMNERELMEVIEFDRNGLKSDLMQWMAVGAVRERSNKKEIKEELESMKFGTLLGVKIAYTENKINYDILSQLGNEACALFKDKIDVYAHVYQKKSGEWSYSLRSLNGQAKKIILDNNLKGDGHDNACGFRDDRYLVGS